MPEPAPVTSATFPASESLKSMCTAPVGGRPAVSRRALTLEALRVRAGAGALAGVRALGEFLYHLCVELRDVVRLPARDQALIDDDGLVDPFGAGVHQVLLYRAV